MLFRSLAAGSISLLDEAALGMCYPGVAPPSLPWVAAVTFALDDRQALADLLAANGVPFNTGPGGNPWIAPDQAEGAIIEFTQ